MKKINIIIPIYNEKESIMELIETIQASIIGLNYEFTFTLIDDGSNDNSWEIIKNLKIGNLKIRKLKFSRNFGHQAAIFSGIEYFDEDAALFIDGDFQDNPKYIPELIKKWEDNFDIVLAKRISRKENFIRKLAINTYFKIQNRLSDINIPKNVGHFSILDKKIIEVIKTFPENKKFLVGIRAYVGFKVAYIDVIKEKRKYGNPKMNIKKLIKLSSEGIIGFSTAPLNFIGIFGILISFSALSFAIYTLIKNILFDVKVLNWDFGLTSIYFLSGIQLLSISILGQYIAKIFEETKNRPFYIIEDFINSD